MGKGDRCGDLSRDAAATLAVCLTNPMWLLWAGVRPLSVQNPGPQVCLLFPPRLLSPSLWETLTPETSQEALLRGKGTPGSLKRAWGQNAQQ
jgi:hypothetical protein